jgi:hypothetical protein
LSELFHEFVKTWCPQARREVELTLECRGQLAGCLVQGHPLDCNVNCQVRTPLCLLKADSITTRRKEAS